MADDAPVDETPVTFNIKSSSDAKYTLTIPLTTTVLELKQKLSTTEYADIPPERQRLIYSGRVLKDPDTLGSYKIKEGNTVHLVKGAASNARQNPANQGSSSTAGPTAIPSNVPSNLASGTGNNPLAGLTGARYAGYAQLPNQNMFGPDGGMGPPPDPDQVIQMLQNPQFASTVNEALQNPQLIDMMIQQNPMLRHMGPEVRQMMQSAEFRRMMTDPEALRNMSRMQQMIGGNPLGGGGGQNPAFPAPGVTDTTPGQEGNRSAQTGSPQPPPTNPFAAMFGNTAAGANPFAMLFPPATSHTPATSPPPAVSAGQGTPQPSTPATENQTNPTAQQQPPPQLPPMYNPALMQQMMAAMGGAQNPAGSTNPSATTNTTNPQNPDYTNPFASLFAGLQNPYANLLGGGYGTPPPAASVDNRPPEERYAEQLRQLNDMGFYEFERNIEALRRTGGSVQGAVEYLLTHGS
ncbi:MAG: hypothetical protein MMC33_000242 [Icmadophila ericetorum]|nr:hypothetical protein [Icmadophila ericetorum]